LPLQRPPGTPPRGLCSARNAVTRSTPTARPLRCGAVTISALLHLATATAVGHRQPRRPPAAILAPTRMRVSARPSRETCSSPISSLGACSAVGRRGRSARSPAVPRLRESGRLRGPDRRWPAKLCDGYNRRPSPHTRDGAVGRSPSRRASRPTAGLPSRADDAALPGMIWEPSGGAPRSSHPGERSARVGRGR
jgi:hypothetical protein